MPGGQVRASIELVIVDVVAGPPHGSFNDCGILGGSADIAGLGGPTSKWHSKVDKAGAIWNEALRARRSSVSSLVGLCSEPIDIWPRPLIPFSESLFAGSEFVFSPLEGGSDLLGDLLDLFLSLSCYICPEDW